MTREDLEERSAAFGREVFALSALVRPREGGRRPADQLLDCATSVGANYRASGRARSRAEFIAKLGLVVEEVDEAVYWLEFIAGTSLAAGPLVDRLYQEATELRAIFAAAYRTARNRHRASAATRSK
ncbi:MAG: four helix bundle protein [Vicinamibacterales bacterium]|nr:four helix bundle protein [Vicinamibacterales bacterium]